MNVLTPFFNSALSIVFDDTYIMSLSQSRMPNTTPYQINSYPKNAIILNYYYFLIKLKFK